MLVHVVNHGTRHRAEAAALFTAEGRSPGELDLIDYARSVPAAADTTTLTGRDPIRVLAARLLGRSTGVRERVGAGLERQGEGDRDRDQDDDAGCGPDEATIHDRTKLSPTPGRPRGMLDLRPAFEVAPTELVRRERGQQLGSVVLHPRDLNPCLHLGEPVPRSASVSSSARPSCERVGRGSSAQVPCPGGELLASRRNHCISSG
jgi:hypothetical protein